MYVYLTRDQDKKEREALLKALTYQSRPILALPGPLPHVIFFFFCLTRPMLTVLCFNLQHCIAKGIFFC